MDFQSLIQNRKMNLKPCATVVTNTDGKRYKITNGQKMELTDSVPFVVDMKPDLQVACVMPGLFLSSQDPVINLEILKEHNIRHILSIGIELNIKFDGIKYYYHYLLDLPDSDIFSVVRNCIEIIHKNRHENILVHCNAGVSRSAAIVISYLMASEKIPYDVAYDIVKRKRMCIKPNDGFIKQLKTSDLFNLL